MLWVKCLPEIYERVRTEEERLALVAGTLDLLILRMLVFGSQHGQGIARAIQQNLPGCPAGRTRRALSCSAAPGGPEMDCRRVGISTNNRRARFYELTRRDAN